MDIGSKIKKCRKDLGLTQLDFGKIMGVNHSVISDIERGETKPSKTFMEYFNYRFIEKEKFIDTQKSANGNIDSKIRDIQHEDIISKFQDKTKARDINKILQEIESHDPTKWNEIELFLKGVLVGVRPKEKENKKTVNSG